MSQVVKNEAKLQKRVQIPVWWWCCKLDLSLRAVEGGDGDGGEDGGDGGAGASCVCVSAVCGEFDGEIHHTFGAVIGGFEHVGDSDCGHRGPVSGRADGAVVTGGFENVGSSDCGHRGPVSRRADAAVVGGAAPELHQLRGAGWESRAVPVALRQVLLHAELRQPAGTRESLPPGLLSDYSLRQGLELETTRHPGELSSPTSLSNAMRLSPSARDSTRWVLERIGYAGLDCQDSCGTQYVAWWCSSGCSFPLLCVLEWACPGGQELEIDFSEE